MSYRNARTPETLRREEQERMLLFQWHNGTDSRQDALPDGGWEAEIAKYPGLRLGLRTGKVQHSGGQVAAWIAGELTLAVIDWRMTWHTWDKSQVSGREPLGAIVNLSKYEAGAWSRLRVLAWCGEIDQAAVFTMKGSISSDFEKGLKSLTNGPLAYARRATPDLPACAFWLTVSAGPRERRGKGGAASWITPPVFDLPDSADPAVIEDWLEARFVGQDLLDRMAVQAPDLLERFKGIGGGKREQPPALAEPTDEHGEDHAPEPQGARCPKGHIYDGAQFIACPVCDADDERIKAQLREEVAARAAFLTAQAATQGPAERNDPNPGVSTTDGFDGLRSATEDARVKELLAEAERLAAQRAPAFTPPASLSQDLDKQAASEENPVTALVAEMRALAASATNQPAASAITKSAEGQLAGLHAEKAVRQAIKALKGMQS
jgi:hypothetical protein